jgi:septal ring factor EnvC (AmiA/AmiB activator)
MNHLQKGLLILLLVMLGIWGCAQGSSGAASAEKIKLLEQKVSRLEEDFRAAAAARDQLRKKLADAEQVTAQLKDEVEALRPVVKERDDLRVQLKARTQERDAVTTQFDGVRKSLREILGQMDAATKSNTPPVTTVSQVKGPAL